MPSALDATHPVCRALLERRDLLRYLYRSYQHGPPPHCRWPASRLRELMAPKSGYHNLLVLQVGVRLVDNKLVRNGRGVFLAASASFGGRIPRCTSLNYLQCRKTLEGN